MTTVRVIRPVVRSFQSLHSKRAAEHVRAGGHALLWEREDRVQLIFRVPTGDVEKDLGYWSLLDLGAHRWKKASRGPLRGLAVARVARDSVDLVRARAERDSAHPRATRALPLDCEACAACCRDNRVVLERGDLARFKAAGREDLAKPPYTRRDGKKVVLRLLRSRDCRHLQSDRRCAIYALRPDSCRVFPAGSESCLFSREVELGVIDGVAR